MKRDRNEKDTKHGSHAISFANDVFWFLKFENHINHIILVPQHFSN
jgi:hypothetical protein